MGFCHFFFLNLTFCPISQNNCPKIEFQNVIIGSLKRHYRYGAIKLKKKKSMELGFIELEFQNAALGF